MVFQIVALGPKLFQRKPGGVGVSESCCRMDVPVPDPVEAAGAARLCKVPGTDVIIFDIVLCPVPAEVAAACVIAADWAVVAAGLTIGWGGANMVSWLATADDPA